MEMSAKGGVYELGLDSNQRGEMVCIGMGCGTLLASVKSLVRRAGFQKSRQKSATLPIILKRWGWLGLRSENGRDGADNDRLAKGCLE